jgi:hypothetical protein
MAKEKNFTLRIDARLLETFLTVCRKEDQVASAVVRESMRAHIRQWRKNVQGRGGLYGNDDVADDDLVPGFVPGAAKRTRRTAVESAEAAETKLKRKLDAEHQAKTKAEVDARLKELRNQHGNQSPT